MVNCLDDRKIEHDAISRLINYLNQEEYDSDSFYQDSIQWMNDDGSNILSNVDEECLRVVKEMLCIVQN